MSSNNFRPTTPLIAADTIIELVDENNEIGIVLIERKNPPYGWAIPGGFVDVGETIEQAAVREAKEEVCLDVKLCCLLGLYSDPSRDDRGHTATAIYIATANGLPQAADDAKNVAVFPLDQFPAKLAFDHTQVLQDYLNYKNTGKVKALYLVN